MAPRKSNGNPRRDDPKPRAGGKSGGLLTGLFIAWWAYMKDRTLPARFTASARGLYAFLLNKWYWDELYDLLFVRPALWIGRLF